MPSFYNLQEIYVSSAYGNDSNGGNKYFPVRSLEYALTYILNGGVVRLYDGVHTIQSRPGFGFGTSKDVTITPVTGATAYVRIDTCILLSYSTLRFVNVTLVLPYPTSRGVSTLNSTAGAPDVSALHLTGCSVYNVGNYASSPPLGGGYAGYGLVTLTSDLSAPATPPQAAVNFSVHLQGCTIYHLSDLGAFQLYKEPIGSTLTITGSQNRIYSGFQNAYRNGNPATRIQMLFSVGRDSTGQTMLAKPNVAGLTNNAYTGPASNVATAVSFSQGWFLGEIYGAPPEAGSTYNVDEAVMWSYALPASYVALAPPPLPERPALPRPATPSITTPASSATGIDQAAVLRSSNWAESPASHWKTDWRVATAAHDNTVVWQSLNNLAYKTATVVDANHGMWQWGSSLARNTQYWASVRHWGYHYDTANYSVPVPDSLWSPWSSFTTAPGPVTTPDTPSITDPTEGASGLARNPGLTCTAFADPDPEAYAQSSHWEVYNNADLAVNHRVWFSDAITTNSAGTTVNNANGTFENALVGLEALAISTYYWFRVRWRSNKGDYSAWSAAVRARVSVFDTHLVCFNLAVTPTLASDYSVGLHSFGMEAVPTAENATIPALASFTLVMLAGITTPTLLDQPLGPTDPSQVMGRMRHGKYFYRGRLRRVRPGVVRAPRG